MMNRTWLVLAMALAVGCKSGEAAKAKATPVPPLTPPTADEVVYFLEGALPLDTVPARVDLKGPVLHCADATCARELLPRVSAWTRAGLADAKVAVNGNHVVVKLSSDGLQDVGIPRATMTVELHRRSMVKTSDEEPIDLVIDAVEARWDHLQFEIRGRSVDEEWPEQKTATLSAAAEKSIRAEVRSRFPRCDKPRIGATAGDPVFAAAWCTGAADGGENIVWLAVRGEMAISFAATADKLDPDSEMSTESMQEDAPIVLAEEVCVNVMDLDHASDRGHEMLMCADRPAL